MSKCNTVVANRYFFRNSEYFFDVKFGNVGKNTYLCETNLSEIMTDIPRWEQKLQSFTMALNRLAQVVNESKESDLFRQE